MYIRVSFYPLVIACLVTVQWQATPPICFSGRSSYGVLLILDLKMSNFSVEDATLESVTQSLSWLTSLSWERLQFETGLSGLELLVSTMLDPDTTIASMTQVVRRRIPDEALLRRIKVSHCSSLSRNSVYINTLLRYYIIALFDLLLHLNSLLHLDPLVTSYLII